MEKYRTELDSIDLQLIRLLEKRMLLSKKIGKFKRDNNIPIYDCKRERKICECLYNKSTLKPKEIDDIFNIIFKISKQTQC